MGDNRLILSSGVREAISAARASISALWVGEVDVFFTRTLYYEDAVAVDTVRKIRVKFYGGGCIHAAKVTNFR